MKNASLKLREKTEKRINKMGFLYTAVWSSTLKLTLNIHTHPWFMTREFISIDY